MRKHLLYLRYVLRHKWFVFVAGLELGVPLWQLIIHDWHKFLPDEWFPYANHFYGYKNSSEGYAKWKDMGDQAFNDACKLHYERAPHHWNHYDESEIMHEHYIREMLADWKAAGKAQTGNDDPIAWYVRNYDNIKLHHETRIRLEQLMTGYEIPPTVISAVENTPIEKVFEDIVIRKAAQ